MSEIEPALTSEQRLMRAIESGRTVVLARSVEQWSAGTRVTYVGHVEGMADPIFFYGPIAVHASVDPRRRTFYVREEDLVVRRRRAMLV